MYRAAIRRGTCPPVLLDYVDAEGEASLRTVAPVALLTVTRGTNSPARSYLQGRCSTAKAVRTFRFDRIKSIADPRTGEVLDTAAWIASLKRDDGEPVSSLEQAEPDTQFAVASPEANEGIVSAPVRAGWSHRALLITLSGGYLIGRWRIIRWVLHYFHVHWGRWL